MGVTPLRPAVFLDRDGVLNRSEVVDGVPRPPASLEEFELIAGVVQACEALRNAGYLLIVATNQPDVARGHQRREIVEQIHQRLRSLLPVDDVRTCYHDNGDDCTCRKPRPGLLLEAAQDWGIDLADSIMVGDRWSDIAAGRAAGCRTALVARSYSQAERSRPDREVRDLSEAADWILGGA